VPVISLDEMDDRLTRLPMWIAVFNREATSDLAVIVRSISARGIARPRLPQEYYELLKERLGWRYWLTDRREYADFRPQFERAMKLLDDDKSRQQFAAVLSFRIAVSDSPAPLPSAEKQYFPIQVAAALKRPGKGVVFVDGGAYDGDTLLQALAELNLKLVFAFEPDVSNFSDLVINAKTANVPVVCIPCGLSNRVESLTFVGQGESSAIGENGNLHIQCVSLDQCIGSQRVDFIKLDVEGHELPVLQGAVDLITRNQPVLAVAAYHRWDDMWRIPDFIRHHCPNHVISYRSHQHNTFDGVFYAVRP